MSENNKPELITTDADVEVMAPEPYDFEFIANALGLIPICGGQAIINLGAITDIEKDSFENATISLHGGESYDLTSAEMAEFERMLKKKLEENQARAREAMLAAQSGMMVSAPTGRRFRQ